MTTSSRSARTVAPKPTAWNPLQRLSRRAKLALASGIVLLVLALAAWPLYQQKTKWQNLFAYNLTPNQAREVSAELDKAGVPHALTPDSDNLLLAPELLPQWRARLSQQGFPHSDHVVRSPNLMDPKPVVDAERALALEAELNHSLRSIGPIQEASVKIALSDHYFDDQPRSSASVYLTLRPGTQLTPEQGTGIARLVAASVPALQQDQVTIVDNSGAAIKLKEAAGADSFQLQLQQQLDQYLLTKAQNQLDLTYGRGRTTVAINAEFNFAQMETKRTDVGVPGQGETVLVEQKTSEIFTPKAPGEAESSLDPSEEAKPKYSKICQATRRKSDEAYTWTVYKIPRISRITCSVSVDVPKQEENVRKLVSGAIGLDEGRGDKLSIACVPYAHSPSAGVAPPYIPVAPPPSPAQPSGLLWPALALLGLPLLGLTFVRRRGAPAPHLDVAGPVTQRTLSDLHHAKDGVHALESTRTQASSNVTQWARDNPDVVAEKLRTTWLS